MTWIRACVALILLVSCGLASAASSQGEEVSAALSRLRPTHPRLLVLPEHVDRTRRLMAEQPELRKLLEGLRREAEKILEAAPVEYKIVGPRLLAQSRLCLTRVYTLSTVYRLDRDERFARRAEKEMLTAAGFSDWNPSHFLDTAEMTHALAIGYDWLYDALSPESRKTIRRAIVEKGLEPARKVYLRPSGWHKARHNWSQVCNGGIGIGALAVADEEPELASWILSRAVESMRIPLRELDPDGGWAEGPGYWHYAMSYTAYLLAALQTALGTDFGLSGMPGMAETGLFRMHSIGPTRLTFNYADAGAGAGGAAEMFYFARVFDRPVYAWHQRRIMRGSDALDLWWFDPRGSDTDGFALPRSAWFRNIDVVFMRSSWDDPDALFVGFKGGDNRANHSHLDLGTFVLDAVGERWAVDLGADEYNMPGYFGNKRWTYYRLRTEGHNTLVIDGKNQETAAKAPIVAFGGRPDRSFAVADLTGAYKGVAQSVRRGIALIDGREVLVQDEIRSDATHDAEWVLHTQADIRIDRQAATLTRGPRQLRIEAVGPAEGEWSVRDVQLDPPQKPLRDTRRLAFRFRTGPGVTLAMRIVPARGGAPAGSVRMIPLEQWK